jgi:hypothetical protein
MDLLAARIVPPGVPIHRGKGRGPRQVVIGGSSMEIGHVFRREV